MEKSQPPQKQPRRLHKYLPIMLVGLVIWALYPHFYRAHLNYIGVCEDVGRALTDEEIINRVLGRFNERSHIHYPNVHSVDRHLYKNIPYSSVAELREKNPDCCQAFPVGSSVTPAERRSGGAGRIVKLHYTANVIDSDGQRKTIPINVTEGLLISNCGWIMGE